MPDMADEKEKVLSRAIDAANRVLYENGITDKLVGELGLIDAERARTEPDAKAIRVIETFQCGCFDCVSPGCGNNGPCCCNGPACHRR